MTLSALLKRVEEATGPSEELDKLVFCAVAAPEDAYVEQSKINGNWCIYHGTDLHGRPRLWEERGWWRHGGWPVTSSLDAALALVEKEMPGVAYRIQRNVDGEIWATIGMGFDSKFGCATPALALLSALLRVKITEQAP